MRVQRSNRTSRRAVWGGVVLLVLLGLGGCRGDDAAQENGAERPADTPHMRAARPAATGAAHSHEPGREDESAPVAGAARAPSDPEDHAGHDHDDAHTHDRDDDDADEHGAVQEEAHGDTENHAGHDHGESRDDSDAEEDAHEHGDATPDAAQADGHDEAHADHDHGGATIAIPPATRQNLGITFVTIERRPVRSTVRLPGQFELRPAARREYHVMLPGRITLLVDQYERVEPGRPLFQLDSPEWQKLQSEMVDAYNAMRRSHADVAVAEATLAEQQQSIAFLEQRIANLAEAQVRQVELEADLAQRRSALPRFQAEVEAAQLAFQNAHTRYDVMLSTAASMTGIPRDELDPHAGAHAHLDGPAPAWRAIDRITVRAEASGVVDRLAATNRGWVETGDLVLDTVDPTALRFHADALQTDLALFEDGQPARIAPPPGGSIPLQDTADGHITVGFQAHAAQRIVPIYMTPERLPRWAKAGVTAYLEVFTNGSGDAVPAIPEAAVVRDGLEHVFFLRVPGHPDEVVRVAAELGARDGRWVEIRNDVHVDDEVVLGGVYPLMLATSATAGQQQGAHVHPDGTVHVGDDH